MFDAIARIIASNIISSGNKNVWTEEQILLLKNALLYAPYNSNVPQDKINQLIDKLLYNRESPIYYSVSFDMRGYGSQIPSQSILKGGYVSVPVPPTHSGKIFVGWYLEDSFVNLYDFTNQVNSSFILYAKWEDAPSEYCTVTFNMNGHGIVSYPPQQVGKGQTVSKPSSDPTDPNWNFRAWYTSSDLSEKYDFNLPVTQDLTLYAKWVEIVSVQLKNDGDINDDGDYNKSLLNRVLSSYDVKIAQSGTYPISPGEVGYDGNVQKVLDPGVVMNGHVLDLNGCTLKSNELHYVGTIFSFVGDSPCIKNGFISGLYDEGQSSYESESAIRLIYGGYTNGLIDNIQIDHICGYTISSESTSYNTYQGIYNERHASKNPYKTPPTYPDEVYEGKYVCYFDLTNENLPYVSATSGYDAVRRISDENVIYEFYDDQDQKIKTAYGIPGIVIEKPYGAKKVHVTTTKQQFSQYLLVEYKYDDSLIINNCKFICNQRLGIANLLGISKVTNCVSKSNGYPREDHTGLVADDTTSGFIDIEDDQPAILYVENCSSQNEFLGLLSEAYELHVKNCIEMRDDENDTYGIRIRNGWSAEIENSSDVYVEDPYTAKRMNINLINTDLAKALWCVTDGWEGSFPIDENNFMSIIPSSRATIQNSNITITYKATTENSNRPERRPYGKFYKCTINLQSDWLYALENCDLEFDDCRIYTNGHYMIDYSYPNSGQVNLLFKDCDMEHFQRKYICKGNGNNTGCFNVEIRDGVNSEVLIYYTLTIQANVHGGAKKQTVLEGETAVRPSPDPQADGYEFTGYYTVQSGQSESNRYDFNTPITGDTIIYCGCRKIN